MSATDPEPAEFVADMPEWQRAARPLYQQILELHANRLDQQAIAARLQVEAHTVRLYYGMLGIKAQIRTSAKPDKRAKSTAKTAAKRPPKRRRKRQGKPAKLMADAKAVSQVAAI